MTKLFWRLFLPLIAAGFVLVESLAWGLSLMNIPSDFAVAGGLLLMAAGINLSAFIVFRFVVRYFKEQSK